MKQYVLVLYLKDDPGVIAAYDAWHQNIWPTKPGDKWVLMDRIFEFHKHA